MSLTLSIIAAVLFGLAGWWMKISQLRHGAIKTLMLGMYFVGTLCFAIHSLIEGSFYTLLDFRSLLLGLVIGLGSGLGNYLFMKALERGPASLISPLSNINIILVVLLGVIVYDEGLSSIQIMSITLLILATVLISVKKNQVKSPSSSNWIGIVLVAVIFFTCRNGGLKVAEELQLASAPILFVAYFMSLLLFLLPQFNKHELPTASASTGWRFGFLTGLFSYAGLQLFAISMSYGQASIVAPVFATNGLVVTLGAIIFLKERLSFLQLIAFICLIAGLIGIKITI